jgi:hypothetical protein
MYTEQLSQALSLAGTEIDPVSQGVGTVTSGGVDMQKFKRVLFILQVGSLGAAGTVDAKLQSSNLVAGAYTDIPASNITQINTGGAGSNRIVTLEIRSDQVAGLAAAGQRFVRLSVTVGGNAVLIGAVALGGEAVEKPASNNDIAAVAQRLVM